MVKKSKGTHFRCRKVLRKHPRRRGMPSLGSTMINYEPGEKVDIKIEPSIHKGRPHRRFHGKTAEVIGSRGKAFLVTLQDGKAEKILIVRPEHLHKHRD